jgi:hypothetical protein
MWLLALPNVALVLAGLLATRRPHAAHVAPSLRGPALLALAALLAAASLELATPHEHARTFGDGATHWLAHVAFWSFVSLPMAGAIFGWVGHARRQRWSAWTQRAGVVALGLVMIPAGRFAAFAATALVYGDAR